MKKLLILFLALSGWRALDAQSGRTIRVDPKYARGGTASQLFDEISYIPLESKRGSEFGAVQRLQISGRYFAFFDYSTKSVFVFGKDGKFKGKISSLPMRGNADAVTQALYGYVLDKASENIYIVYDKDNGKHAKRLAVFSADGRLLQSRELGPAFDELGTGFSFLSDGRVVFSSGNLYDKNLSSHYLYIVKDFDSVVGRMLEQKPDDPLGKSWHNQLDNQSISEEGSMWYRLYDKMAYEIGADGRLGAFRIVLPLAMTLDSSFYGDPSVLKTEASVDVYLQKHQNLVSYLSNLQKTKNMLGFTFVKYNYSLPGDSYLYSLSTGNLYCTFRIVPDSLCYFLPLFASSEIAGMDEGYIYLSIPSFSMFATDEANKDKLWKSNPTLAAYFANAQNRKGNSVLVRLKIKATL